VQHFLHKLAVETTGVCGVPHAPKHTAGACISSHSLGRHAGTTVEFEVEWEDGSRAWIKQGDAQKYAARYAQGTGAGAGAARERAAASEVQGGSCVQASSASTLLLRDTSPVAFTMLIIAEIDSATTRHSER
jgi:hypothetical protein